MGESMPTLCHALLVALALLPAATVAAPAGDTGWPDYRGSGRDGHTQTAGVPTVWSETQGVKWKTPIPGRGWSTPAVWGKQIWLTTATPDGHELSVICLDRDTGKVLTNQLLLKVEHPQPVAGINSYASPSPVIEDGRVYVHYGTYLTACLDTRTLKPIWSRTDLNCNHAVGPGSSPALAWGKLVITLDGTDTQRTVALDPRTGKTLWTANRSSFYPAELSPENRKSFNTPVPALSAGRKVWICPAAGAVFAYDEATGAEVWRVRGGGYSGSSRVVLCKDLAIVTTAYDESRAIAIRLGGQGDVTATHLVWSCNRNMPYKPSCLAVDGLYYAISDTGVATCLDAATGEQVWRERIGGNYSSSPILVDGKILVFSEQGKATWLKPGRSYVLLGQNELGDGCMASPSAIGKSLYVRTRSAVYRIGQ